MKKLVLLWEIDTDGNKSEVYVHPGSITAIRGAETGWKKAPGSIVHLVDGTKLVIDMEPVNLIELLEKEG